MNCLTRANPLHSTTSFQCITKSLHVFSNITSQADVSKRSYLVSNEPSHRGSSLPRKFSNFSVHPEKLKQIVKEKDGQLLCNFFDSDDYKRRITQMTEKQKQMITQEVPIEVNENEVKYQHVLSCALPMENRNEYIEKAEQRRVPKKITIMSAILKKKTAEEKRNVIYDHQRKPNSLVPVTKKKKLELKSPKKYKKVSTTILPIYLKKMEKQRLERKPRFEAKSSYEGTARKVVDAEDIDFDKQVLNLRNYEVDVDDQNEGVNEEPENVSTQGRSFLQKAKLQSKKTRRKAVSFPNLKLVQYAEPPKAKLWPPKKKVKFVEKEDGIELTSSKDKLETQTYSDNKLMVTNISELVSPVSNEIKKGINHPPVVVKEAAKQDTQVEQMKANVKKQWSFLTKKLKPRRKPKKTEKLSESAKENLPAGLEFDAEKSNDLDLNKVYKRNMSTYRLKPKVNKKSAVIDDVLTLYEKVKIGTSNASLPETTRYPFENQETKTDHSLRGPSLTYKVVSSTKKRREDKLKEQYKVVSKLGKELCSAVEKNILQESVRAGEDFAEHRKVKPPVSFVDSGKHGSMAKEKGTYAEIVKDNGRFGKFISKPLTPTLDFRKKAGFQGRENEDVSLSGAINREKEEIRKFGERIVRPPTPFKDFSRKDNSLVPSRMYHRWL